MSFSSIVRVSVLGVLGLTLLAGGGGASGTGLGVVVPKGACVVKFDVTKSTTWSPASCPDGYLVK